MKSAADILKADPLLHALATEMGKISTDPSQSSEKREEARDLLAEVFHYCMMEAMRQQLGPVGSVAMDVALAQTFVEKEQKYKFVRGAKVKVI
jgi:hypothetical protein